MTDLCLFNVLNKVAEQRYAKRLYARWMMINHSTLEYHVTNFNTFFRWLWRKNQTPNTLL